MLLCTNSVDDLSSMSTLALVSHFGQAAASILDYTFGKELNILFNKLSILVCFHWHLRSSVDSEEEIEHKQEPLSEYTSQLIPVVGQAQLGSCALSHGAVKRCSGFWSFTRF